MVIGSYIRCDMCDAVFKLRLQLDKSIYAYELPIGIKCPGCGNTFDCRYSYKHGILPKQYVAETEDVVDYSIAYSPQLPIPAGQFYQEKDTIGLTPYMELSGYYNMKEIYAFGRYIQSILDDFYPLRELYSKCLPILKKGNVKAFQRMMQKLCDIKSPTRTIHDLNECFSAYHDFFVSAWHTFAVKTYRENAGKVFGKILEAAQTMPLEQLTSLYDKLNGLHSISKWRWDAWEDFGQYTNHVERYFPAMFFLYMGDLRLPHTPDFCIVTISQKQSNDNYADGYTRLSQILPLLVGLLNWRETGDYDIYPNADSGMKGIKGICNFASIAEGLRLEKLDGYADALVYLMGCMNSHMRNALDHRHVEMDPISQQIKYFYRLGDDSFYTTGRLIDECYMTHICMLHIIEAVLIVDVIKKRLR